MAFFATQSRWSVAYVVFLPSRVSSFMSLSSIFHDSFFSQQSGHTLNMLKFNMQR